MPSNRYDSDNWSDEQWRNAMTPTADKPGNATVESAPPPAKPKNQPKLVQVPAASAAEKKARKRPVRDRINRSYYVFAVNPDGEIHRSICKFPTIGQAKKNKPMVCKAAGVAETAAKIARVVFVD